MAREGARKGGVAGTHDRGRLKREKKRNFTVVRRAVGIMMWERGGQLRSKEREIKGGGGWRRRPPFSPHVPAAIF